MLLRVFILLSLIRYVLVMDFNKYTDLFRTQRSCSNIEYYDRFQHKCQKFPGGGYLVFIDHSAKCTSEDNGLHTFNRNDFYYYCSPDGVMIGMCPTDMKFDESMGRCVQATDKPHDTIRIYDESENCGVMIPNCNKNGKFPVPSNCSFYYDCQRNNHNYLQYVYKCPYETMYHPDLHRCITMTKCYVDHNDILDRFDYDYFPKCIVQGQFRTSRHSNLFYRCIPNMDGSFFQIRYECPPMMYYNIEKERCYMGHNSNCEYIPWDKIVKDYATKHNLKMDSSIPKHTTTISTLNTTITTTCPCLCSSTTAISSNATYTFPFTNTTPMFANFTTADETTSPTTESTEFKETEAETDSTISQTDETTITNEPLTTSGIQTEKTDNNISISVTNSTEGIATVSMKSSDTSIRMITKEISTVKTGTASSDTTKTKYYTIPKIRETKLPIKTTQAISRTTKADTLTSFMSKLTTYSTTTVSDTTQQQTAGNTNGASPIMTKSITKFPYTSPYPITGNINETSTKSYTRITIPSKQETRGSTLDPSTSGQPTTSTKDFTRTSKGSSSEEYDSYEEFTWDDVAWYRHHRTSKIPSGYPTPSTKKPRAYFHPNPPPFEYPDANYWDDSHSHESTKSSTPARYSSTTHNPSTDFNSTTHIYQDVVTEPIKNASTTNYSDMTSSAKPPSSYARDPDASESNESNSLPVRCYNNGQGGLTCDGVKGKDGGWFELPGYLLRYRKRSGKDESSDKQKHAEVNLRLRYPNAYKLEAYPKQKRRVKKPDDQ